jgi:hypothetical protein
MKKVLFISAVVLLAAACHKEPFSQDSDGDYLVYTSPAKDFDFSKYKTFDIIDSVLVVGQSEKPYFSQSDNALALIQSYRTNMEKLGYIYLPSNPEAQLGIQLTYMVKTERYVQYYNDPYWWLDYPGYWPSGYWGNWTGWYYPYPVTYTYTTNALVTDMVDLTGTNSKDGKLEIVWSNYIGGPAGTSLQGDIKRMQNSIDQAFAQSPYLKPSASR